MRFHFICIYSMYFSEKWATAILHYDYDNWELVLLTNLLSIDNGLDKITNVLKLCLMEFCFDISQYINTLRYRDSIHVIQLIHPGFIRYAIYSFIIQSIVFIYRAYINYSMMCLYSVQMYHLHLFACGFSDDLLLWYLSM